MSFFSGGHIGVAFSSGNNQTSLVMTTTSRAEAGNLVVLCVAVDNNQTTDGDSTAVSGITDSATGNTWARNKGFANGNGTNQTGADISIWSSVLVNAIPAGGTITASFTTAATSDATAMSAWSPMRTDIALLLHFDGDDASTTFTDNSPAAHTVTASGDAQIDTAQSKFGGASLQLDGTGDFLSLDGSSQFAFGQGDWEVDCWVRPGEDLTGIANIIWDFRPNATNGFYPTLFMDEVGFHYFTNSANRLNSGTGEPTVGTWYNIRVSRVAGTTRLFVDGVASGGTFSDSSFYLVGAARPTIGADGSDTTASNIMLGHVDELRIRNGVGTDSNFTPETAAWSNPAAITSTISVEGTPGGLADDAADPGSLNVTTANIECFRIRAIASESNSTTALTPTANWKIIQQAVSGTGTSATEMGVRGEFIISTGTGAASDPTAFSADHASAYVAYKEVQAAASLIFNPTAFFQPLIVR